MKFLIVHSRTPPGDLSSSGRIGQDYLSLNDPKGDKFIDATVYIPGAPTAYLVPRISILGPAAESGSRGAAEDGTPRLGYTSGKPVQFCRAVREV